MNNHKIRVGITHGDTNGIGYEIILKMLEDERIAEMYTIVLYGSAKAAGFYRKALELPSIQLNRIDRADEAREGVVNIVNVVGEFLKIEPGQTSPEAGAAALAALEAAVADIKNGDIDVLVTAPINKHGMQSETFHFPGHTEYLETSFSSEEEPCNALMIMCTEDLRVALVTSHIALSKVPASLTKEGIVDKLRQFDSSLQRDFGVHAPRIAVLSLNPHAGEEGLLGAEETEIISPAIAEAREDKIQAFGPYSPDGFFGSGNYKAFDGILAMYHDQGLAPFKTLSMNEGVNFTAGLPFVRTSPDHGTGYDIVCKGVASPDSLRSALYMATDIFRHRQSHDIAYRHPLRHQHLDRDKGNKGDITIEPTAD